MIWNIVSRAVCILVDVTEKDGSASSYQYKKNMPEDIDPDKCKFKVLNHESFIPGT